MSIFDIKAISEKAAPAINHNGTMITPDIYLFGDHIYVGFDEAGQPFAVATDLETVQRALTEYAKSLDPFVLPPCPRFAVISVDTKALLLGRYETVEAVNKAIDGKHDTWALYEVVR